MAFLKTGDQAPDFTAIDQDGKEFKLSDFKGSKVILYFYPKADTPGCTAESCNLRDNYSDLMSKGFKIIGVSADNQSKQKKCFKSLWYLGNEEDVRQGLRRNFTHNLRN